MNKSLKMMLLSLMLVSGFSVVADDGAGAGTPDPKAQPQTSKNSPAPATGTFLSSVWEQVWTKRSRLEYVLFAALIGETAYIAWDKWLNKDAKTYEEQDVEDDGSGE